MSNAANTKSIRATNAIEANPEALFLLGCVCSGDTPAVPHEGAEDALTRVRVIRLDDDGEYELTRRGELVRDELNFRLGDDWT